MTVHAETGPAIDPEHLSSGIIRKPAIFAPLFAPFGISSGYITVTLAFLLSEAGLSTAIIGTIIALSVWPQTVKMLWAPFVDTIGNPKVWYGVGATIVGVSILLMSVIRKTEDQVPPEWRGRASGWSQAGNLGGAGIGGGVGLLLAENVSATWVSGAVLAGVCFACWGATLFLPRLVKVGLQGVNYVAHLKEVLVNVWQVARSRIGYLALIIMILPIGSGGVPWSAIAGEWNAGANTVATVNGVLGGVASIVGARVAGYICDRMDLKKADSMFGILVGLVAVSLIGLPRTQAVFVGGVLAYQAMVGMAYTGYAAIVLEAIGKKSPATNWNLMAALSNIPIALMSQIDGHVHDAYGTDMMLLGELVLPAAALALFGGFVFLTRPRAAAA